MNIGIAQINTTPGDFRGNTNRITTAIYKNAVDLLVFPELSIPGYLCRDLVYGKDFVEKNLQCLYETQKVSENKDTYIVVGYIDYNHSGIGKPFRNMAAVIYNGAIVATYAKQLLPFYDVFDEGRYFEPGTQPTVVNICGKKLGICICEDLWNDKGMDSYNYNVNPVQQYSNLGVDGIISLNSSPFVDGKPEQRMEMLQQISSDRGITLIYANQVGAQDELVFDGNSAILCNGRVAAKAFSQTEQIVASTWENKNDRSSEIVKDPLRDRMDIIITGIEEYVRKSGFSSVVVGSSGGIDSAVVITLACRALGPENVWGVRMPNYISSSGSITDALQLHKNLDCNDILSPLAGSEEEWNHLSQSLVVGLDKIPGEVNPIAWQNIQARLRGIKIMHISNSHNMLALATGNKTELALGYCTLYGDMCGALAPIGDLYKGEVYELARFLNKYNDIPQNIIDKAPSAELAPGQADEDDLMPYDDLDAIARLYIEQYVDTWEAYKKLVDVPVSREGYERIVKMIHRSEFKRRQAAPAIKVHQVAFGVGRRIPIVKGNG